MISHAEHGERELQRIRSEREQLERRKLDAQELRKQALLEKVLAKSDKAKREAQARIRQADADLAALEEEISDCDQVLEHADSLRDRASRNDSADAERALKLARLGARYEQRAADVDQLLDRLADGMEALIGIAAEIKAHAIEGGRDEWRPAHGNALTLKLDILLRRALGGMLPSLQAEPRLDGAGNLIPEPPLAQFAAGWRQYLGHVPEPINPKATKGDRS